MPDNTHIQAMQGTSMTQTPKVLISYSHDSPEHADRVLSLADQLIADGVDCVLDIYEVAPPEGWPRWMDKQVRTADFVLMICTERYYQRMVGGEEPGIGQGVRWEGHLIYQQIYDSDSSNSRFIPVLFEDGSPNHIPPILRGVMSYRLDSDEAYEALYRRLTDQPAAKKPLLGKLKRLTKRARKQDFFARLNRNTAIPNGEMADQATAITVDLQMIFSRIETDGSLTPVPSSQTKSKRVLRDMKPLVAPSKRVQFRTGDIVRIDVITDTTGYLKAFNIGPSGNVNDLYPLDASQTHAIEAGKALTLCEVQMMPPAGREKILAVWSAEPLVEDCEQLSQLVDSCTISAADRQTRDMIPALVSVEQLRAKRCWIVTWELDHHESKGS